MSTRTYIASEQTYLSKEGQMVYPGEKFTVDAETPTAASWLGEDGQPLSDDEKVGKPPRKDAGKAKAATAGASIDTAQIADVLSASLAAASEASARQMADLVEALRAAPANPAPPAEAADLYSKLSLAELKALAGVRKISVSGKNEAELADALRANDAEG